MPTIGGYSNTRVKEVVKVSSSYMCQYSYHKNRIVILISGTILEEYIKQSTYTPIFNVKFDSKIGKCHIPNNLCLSGSSSE
jgi:hypothetical protein